MNPLPFLILETGRPLPALRRLGPFTHWIRVAAGLGARDTAVCAVMDDAQLPNPRRYAGVLVTGSGAMVTERLPWSERSADWLRDADARGLPLFGICYGHQLLAHAFGGEVGYNPRGREMGTVAVQLKPEAAADPLFAGLGPSLRAHATHLQTVLAPPPGATLLAHSEQDDCQAFRLRDSVWGVQFHPEFSARMMRGYIHARREDLSREGRCHSELSGAVKPAPRAREVLRRFVRFARHAHS
ncbi:MAG: glutamine amidotransferase [Aquimonas sp.]|nr:glutamine amidotransferase [Aquimonas sp.]